MFYFRKKTKTVSDVVHRRKSGFAKKPIVRRESALSSSEIDDRKVYTRWRWSYWLLWAIFASVTVYVLVFSSFLRLDTLYVDGAIDIPEQEIGRLVQSDMSGKYFGIIPKDNFFVFPRKVIESDVKEHFKKISSITVSREFPRRLTVRIQERKTIVLWCVNETCFYMDENGYAYAPVDATQSIDQRGRFLKIIDTSGQSVDANEPILDQESIHFAGDIQEKLQRELGIETETECSTPSRFSEELTLKTKEGFTVSVSTRLPLEKSLQTLRLLFKKEISKERRHRLKYVDIRTENRVYYSVEGETVSAPETPRDGALQQSIALPTDGTAAEKEKKKK